MINPIEVVQSSNAMEEPQERVRRGSIWSSCSIFIYATAEPNSLPYGPNNSYRCLEYNRTRESRGPLDILNLVTDVVLLIGAAIFIISLLIVFSIVVLAIIREYSIKCYYDSNRSFITHVNTSCGIRSS